MFSGIWAKLVAGVAALAALIGAIFFYNRNQQALGGDKVKAKVADEASEAGRKADQAGKAFIEKGGSEDALKNHRF